jgi:hypothetical protein
MGVYQRGENWYVDFTFKGQRIRESIGSSGHGVRFCNITYYPND